MATAPTTQPPVKQLIGEELLPIAPMIYVAWADGCLSDEEIDAIRSQIAAQPWIEEHAAEQLDHWLDPENPPSATELEELSEAIRECAEKVPEAEKKTLADLGLGIAETEADVVRPEWSGEQMRQTLLELEQQLGVVGVEATRSLLQDVRRRSKADYEEPAARFDIQKMTRVLDGEYKPYIDRVKEVLARDEFQYVYELSKEEYREQVLDWLQILADEGLGKLAFPGEIGGEDDLGGLVATFQALGMYDLSLVVKFGVQFGLFGGSILFLGTERHHEEYLPRVADLELPGGFAMTEVGHGSNVRDIETTATYDPEADEFVIDTPTGSARKEWIGNAAAHGRMMTVFAQLEVDEHGHGVHAFLVPVRDENGNTLKGVRIEDCGHKMGLNGVDNGRIWFDEVRVPRQNLLDRYGTVDEEGNYSSPIPSAGKRFFTMLGTLVGGRVSVGAAARV